MKERREASRNTLVLLPVLLVLILSACGDAATTLVPAATAVSSTPAAFSSSAIISRVAPTNNATITASTKVFPPGPSPSADLATLLTASAKNPTPLPLPVVDASPATGIPIPNLGKELEGQLIAIGSDPNGPMYLDIRIAKVVAYESFTYRDTLVKPTHGAFLVVVYDVANVGKYPPAFVGFFVSDGADKRIEFAQTTIPDKKLPDFNPAYQGTRALNPNPGFVGHILSVYDVSKDIAGLKLKANDYYGFEYSRPLRKPSLESFKLSGGKEPDSQAGQELVGKTGTTHNENISYNYKVTQVERLTSEVETSEGLIKSDGVFLVLIFEVEYQELTPTNLSKIPLDNFGRIIIDNQGRSYYSTDNQAVIQALEKKYNTATYSLGAGQKGTLIQVFEVIKEATGFYILSAK
ncbi:MAG: hypothetical protein WCS37_00530 [Chloroflexota bacterium]